MVFVAGVTTLCCLLMICIGLASDYYDILHRPFENNIETVPSTQILRVSGGSLRVSGG